MLDNREHMLDKHKLLLTLENRFWYKLTLRGSLSQAYTWKTETHTKWKSSLLHNSNPNRAKLKIWKLQHLTGIYHTVSLQHKHQVLSGSAWCKFSPFPISFLLSSVLVSSMGSTGWGEFKQCTEPREEIQPAS